MSCTRVHTRVHPTPQRPCAHHAPRHRHACAPCVPLPPASCPGWARGGGPVPPPWQGSCSLPPFRAALPGLTFPYSYFPRAAARCGASGCIVAARRAKGDNAVNNGERKPPRPREPPRLPRRRAARRGTTGGASPPCSRGLSPRAEDALFVSPAARCPAALSLPPASPAAGPAAMLCLSSPPCSRCPSAAGHSGYLAGAGGSYRSPALSAADGGAGDGSCWGLGGRGGTRQR